jgi:hypothetical protein
MNCQDANIATLVNNKPSSDLVLRLYSNRYTPSDNTKASDLSETKGFGYKAVKLSGSKWNVKNGEAEYPPVEFLFSGAVGKIYGYYLTKSNSGDVIGAEKFVQTVEITGPDQKIIITPKLGKEYA